MMSGFGPQRMAPPLKYWADSLLIPTLAVISLFELSLSTVV